MNKMDRMYLAMQNKLRSFLEEQQGETNIIAIVIVLGIVVALAILFGDKLNDLFTTWWDQIKTTGAKN